MAKYYVEVSKVLSRTIEIEAKDEEEAEKSAFKLAQNYLFWNTQPTMTAKVRREHNLLDEQIERKLRELGFLENKGVFWRCNDDKTATIIYHSAFRFMHPMDNLRGWELETYPDLIKTLKEYGIRRRIIIP